MNELQNTELTVQQQIENIKSNMQYQHENEMKRVIAEIKEKAIQNIFNNIPDLIKKDLTSACNFAKMVLGDKEFEILADNEGEYFFCVIYIAENNYIESENFKNPAEAIIHALCTYLTSANQSTS